MRTSLIRIFLAFLIAWIPASLGYAKTMTYQADNDTPCAPHAQHAQMQHMQDHTCKADTQHGHSLCHDCDLCYLSIASAPVSAALDFPPTADQIAYLPAALASFFPEQPERPPRA